MQLFAGMLACIGCILMAAATNDESDGPFQGEWRTTIGPVKLEQISSRITPVFG